MTTPALAGRARLWGGTALIVAGVLVGVIPAHDLGADADRMLRQPHALGDVLLEDQPEAAALLEPIDLPPEVGAKRVVVDPLQKDVELAPDHSPRLAAR